MNMSKLSVLLPYLPVLIPLVIAELTLAVTALISVLKHKSYKFFNRPVWILIVLFIQIIGPILYFALGRKEE